MHPMLSQGIRVEPATAGTTANKKAAATSSPTLSGQQDGTQHRASGSRVPFPNAQVPKQSLFPHTFTPEDLWARSWAGSSLQLL